MDARTISVALFAWVVVAFAIGSSFIIFGTTLMATVGTVIIIFGLVSLMPAFSYRYWGSEEVDTAAASEPPESTDLVEVTDPTEPTEPTDVEEDTAETG